MPLRPATPRSTPLSTTSPISTNSRAVSPTLTARIGSSSATLRPAVLRQRGRNQESASRVAGPSAASPSSSPVRRSRLLIPARAPRFSGAGLRSGTLGAPASRPAARIGAGLTSGSIHDRLNNGYLNGSKLHHRSASGSGGCGGDGFLHHRLRRSWPQHLPRSIPAELGFLADQEFPNHRAPDAAFHHGLLQHLESRQLRQSGHQRRGSRHWSE